jgi:hypothetical protein
MHILKPSECPECGKNNDVATNANGGDDPPNPGDISVCFYCGTALEFTDELTLTRLDLSTLGPEESILISKVIKNVTDRLYSLKD